VAAGRQNNRNKSHQRYCTIAPATGFLFVCANILRLMDGRPRSLHRHEPRINTSCDTRRKSEGASAALCAYLTQSNVAHRGRRLNLPPWKESLMTTYRALITT